MSPDRKEKRISAEDVVALLLAVVSEFQRAEQWGVLNVRVDVREGEIYEVGVRREVTYRRVV